MDGKRRRVPLEDVPQELRRNPIVQFLTEIDPATERLLEEGDRLDRERGTPDPGDPDEQ